MSVTLRRIAMVIGLVLFGVAALLALFDDTPPSLYTLLGLVAAGLACWIAAALP